MRHHARAEPASVFLDRSGRRRRLVRMVGASLGVGLIAVLAVLSAALFGGGTAHLPGFPDVAGNPQVTAGPATPVGANPGPAAGRPTRTEAGPATSAAAASTRPGRGPTHTPPHPTKSK